MSDMAATVSVAQRTLLSNMTSLSESFLKMTELRRLTKRVKMTNPMIAPGCPDS